MALEPFALARKLIDVPSVTGEERDVAVLLESILRALGLDVRRQEISSERFNLFASTERLPRVLLCTHIDTVPPFFPASDDDQAIFGRGACDTKGILAAMLCAVERLLSNGVRDLGVLLVVGEETDSVGAKVANSLLKGCGSEFVVVGEPTESQFVRASKGAFTAVLRFTGVAAHSAYPERGDSAIQKMMSALREITEADWGSHPQLGSATVNIGVVRGGHKPNIVPAEAEAEMILRTVVPPEDVRQRLSEIAGRYGGTIIRSHGNEPMFMVVPPGVESTVVAFNTDVPHLRDLGKPILFGPGSILDAHSSNEKIAKKEIISAIETYRELVSSLLSRETDSFDAQS